jgi:predicted nuclease of predicted toxin-antitoxin system
MPPALKFDENLPFALVALARERGFDALSVADQGLGGAPDDRVAAVCAGEGRVLVTLDLDFGDIRRYVPERHAGLVVLRVARQDAPHLTDVLRRVLDELQRRSPAGQLWVVDESAIRVRGG